MPLPGPKHGQPEPAPPAAARLDLELRPEAPEDEAFRFELYASTRQEELDAWGWPEESRAAFLQMQFQVQAGYRTQFPRADFEIIWLGGRRIGRWIVDRGGEAWVLADIALLPQYRNAGIGTGLIRRLQAEAAQAGKPVRLTVLKGCRAARLYERLGFCRISSSELHDEMEWFGSFPVAPKLP